MMDRRGKERQKGDAAVDLEEVRASASHAGYAGHSLCGTGGRLSGLKELDSCYIYCVMLYWELIYGVIAI